MRLILCLTVAATLFGQEVPEGLLGRWRTSAATAKGIGAMYEFKTGGTVLVRPGAVVLGTYKVEGNVLVLPPITVGGPPNRQRMEMLNPGQLKFYSGDKVSMELSRVGRPTPGRPVIEGEWVGMRQMDGQKLEMRMFYYPGGQSLFLLPFQTQQAKYRIEKGRMTLELPDGKAAEGPFTLKGKTLSIPGVRPGSQTLLTRY